MFDLSTFLNPQAQNSTSDSQPATNKDAWDAYLANPAAKAALLSFGLNALAGGWGSPGQNIAASIGAGLESGAQVGANQEAEADKQKKDALAERDFQARQANEAADRTNKMDIAKLYSDNRIDVANIKTSAKDQKKTQYLNMAVQAIKNDPTNIGASPEEIGMKASRLARTLYEQDPTTSPLGGWDDGGGLDGNLAGPQGGPSLPGTTPPTTGVPNGTTQTNRPVSPQLAPSTKYYINPKTGERIQWNGKQWVPG